MDIDLLTAVIGLAAAIVGGGGGAYLTGQQMTLAASRRDDRKLILDLLVPQLMARVEQADDQTVERFPILRIQQGQGSIPYWIAILWVIGDLTSRTGWRDRRQFARLRKTIDEAGIDTKRNAYPRRYINEPPRGADRPSTFEDGSDESLQLFLYGCDLFATYLMRTFDSRLERIARWVNYRFVFRRSRPAEIRQAAAIGGRRKTY